MSDPIRPSEVPPLMSPPLQMFLSEDIKQSNYRLFERCNPHTQQALIQLHDALETLHTSKKTHSCSHDDTERHIKSAMDTLLHGKVSDLSSSFQTRLASSQLAPDVVEWLSVTYSPRENLRLQNQLHFIDRQQSSLRSELGALLSPLTSECTTPTPSDSGIDSAEVKKELDNVMEWDTFDVFALNEHSGGHSLSVLVPYLFSYFNLYKELKLSKAKVKNFWVQVELGYQDVSYHNATHAADVVQAIAWFLRTETVKKAQLKPLEICAALVAAGIHDHDHPGVNNDFLVKSHHELAIRYNDKSVLENHHASTGLQLLLYDHNNFLSHLDKASLLSFRQLVVSMVLATDMSIHFQLQAKFEDCFGCKAGGEQVPLEMESVVKRDLLLDLLIHCADISNCGKPFHFAENWGERVILEFFAQGDKEKALGIPVSPMTQRVPYALENSQRAFIQHVVRPMFETMVPLIPDTKIAFDHATNNIKLWGERMERKKREEEEKKT